MLAEGLSLKVVPNFFRAVHAEGTLLNGAGPLTADQTRGVVTNNVCSEVCQTRSLPAYDRGTGRLGERTLFRLLNLVMSMTNEETLHGLRAHLAEPSSRIDSRSLPSPNFYPPATLTSLKDAETAVGVRPAR